MAPRLEPRPHASSLPLTTRQRQEGIFQVGPGDLQVSDGHTALEQSAQDCLGLIAEQPDVLPGALDVHDRQSGEYAVAKGHSDTEADLLAGDARLQLARRGIGDHDTAV